MQIVKDLGERVPGSLRAALTEAALHLKMTIPKADVSGLSEYNRAYLGRKLAVLDDVLCLYATILGLALARTGKKLSETTFVEYGAGLGLMSLLAVRAGVGTVIVNDIYDVSVEDAGKLGRILGLAPARSVCGTLEDVLRTTQDQGLRIDAVASYDVIEHVYDASGLFHLLAALPGPVSVTMASGANPYNPRIARPIRRLHHDVETRNREPEPGRKERDCLLSYREARAEIVRQCFQEAGRRPGEQETQALAERTRGMDAADIRQAVSWYLTKGALPAGPAHPSNTCDPYTGNFAERLMCPGELSGILSKNGFRARVLAGRYGAAKNAALAAAKALANAAILVSGPAAMALSPYYVVYGVKDE
ncbi:MAG: hypothetical protein AB1921_02330 [Thermodesulfobacteriota bacterium]